MRPASSFQHTYAYPPSDLFNPQPGHPGKKQSRKFFYDPMYLVYLTTLMDPRKVTIDVGANIGAVTRYLALHSQKPIIAIEPSTANFKALLKNTADLKKVSLYNCAASTQRIVEFLDRGTVNDHVATRRDTTGTHSLVRGIPLDKFAHLNVGLIKIDVEGWELDVLESGRVLLAKQRPVVAIEVDPNWLRRYDHTPKDIIKFFAALKTYRSPVNKFGQVERGPAYPDNLFFVPRDLYYPKLYLGFRNLHNKEAT
jgi:FkbM family methyltransferase